MNLVAHFGQNFGDTEGDGGVNIVAASVFDARDRRFVWDINRFVYGQRIHVGANSDNRAGPCAFEEGDNAMMGDVGFDLVDAKREQFFGDDSGGAYFAIGELGVHVKVAADLDERRTKGVSGLGNLRRMIGKWRICSQR